VQFTDRSINTPTSWAWAFGDGGASALQHPSHTYQQEGAYTVSLEASSPAGSDTETKTGYVTALPMVPGADFDAAPRLGIAPLLVSFVDRSTNTPTSWAWTFGDAGTSAEQNPTHTYQKPGQYDVTLTAANLGGPGTATQVHYLLVSFPDVPVDPEQWALRDILACVDAGIVSGYQTGNYEPAWKVTRDQMAVYISRALAGGDAKVVTAPAVATFTDVPTDYWAFEYVEYAKAHGIVVGYTPTTYAPTVEVDRGQMAAFIARAMADPTGEGGLAGYQPPASPSFPDVAKDFWAFRYIEYIKGAGVTGGYPDLLYHPEYIVTRDQMAVYVQRAFELPKAPK